jgi:hypothetical protein
MSHRRRTANARRIGIGLSMAAGAIAIVGLGESPFAYGDPTDTSVLVVDGVCCTDVDTTTLIPGFLTNITENQP